VKPSRSKAGLWLLVVALVGSAWVSCSGDSSSAGVVGPDGGGAGGSGGHAATGGGGKDGSGAAGSGGIIIPDGGGCTPSTCTELNANCGPVTDPKCGGVVDCGSCPSGQSCGNGGPNLCGTSGADGCSPLDCASQNANCGQIGDGCGNTISCGSCTAPKTCGGATPNQCGCTGICAQIPDCAPGTTTTLAGKVLDPAGKNPIYNALVYIPNDPSDPGLAPFPAGITCDVCGATAAGNPLVTTYTAPDGTFTLQNVPVGTQLPLIVQLGKWRRQFKVDITTSCGANSVAAGTLTMPKNHNEGDIPRIGILSGGFDPIECVLRKMGVQDSEFTDPSGQGHIQFYLAAGVGPDPFGGFPGCPNPYGYGARISASTPNQAALFGTSGGQPTINQYDVVILSCEGFEDNNQANWGNLGAYTSAGGRVFMTDFSYNWIATSNGTGGAPKAVNPAYTNVANWVLGQNAQGSPRTGVIDLASNPKGADFQKWLEIVGVSPTGSGNVSLNPVFHNSNSVVSPTQQWLHDPSNNPIHFTFNTPVGAASASQCGRVVFSDWHADTLTFASNYSSCPFVSPGAAPHYSHGLTFPNECDNNAMTPQEAILEFMLFDLTACVQPYQPLCNPTTCAAQNIECGPAGDGCGNLLDCGPCPAGQFCGGGGPGKCGTTNNCTPLTCASQSDGPGLRPRRAGSVRRAEVGAPDHASAGLGSFSNFLEMGMNARDVNVMSTASTPKYAAGGRPFS
jgi:hypothetical protein